MNFLKKHWLVLAAIPLAIIQPELIPLIMAGVAAKIVANL